MSERLRILQRGEPVELETAWVGDATSPLPPVVFLHEGLGSVAMWKGFPHDFCVANGLRGFVFSRYGYGRSTPRPAAESWPAGFMHQQAFETLPRLFEAADIERPFLFGHSDGGSIALLHASRHDVAGVVAVAPHLFVEGMAIASIEKAREAYLAGDLKRRLAAYHDDADSAFFGWNDAWLSAQFRGWNIEREVASVRCPVLAVQGEQDEYGTLEQIRAIGRILPEQTRLLVIPECGHSPHRDRPGILVREAGRFIADTCALAASAPPSPPSSLPLSR